MEEPGAQVWSVASNTLDPLCARTLDCTVRSDGWASWTPRPEYCAPTGVPSSRSSKPIVVDGAPRATVAPRETLVTRERTRASGMVRRGRMALSFWEEAHPSGGPRGAPESRSRSVIHGGCFRGRLVRDA